MRGLRVAAAWLVVLALSGCIQLQVGSTPPPAAPQDEGKGATIAWTPLAPRVGQVVTLKATVRSPEPGDAVTTVSWSFGDGSGGSGMTVQHVYRVAGEYKVRMVAETKLSGKLGTSRDLVVDGPSPGTGGGGSGGSGGSGGRGGGLVVGPPSPLAPPLLFAEVTENVASFSFVFETVPEAVAWDFGDGATSNETAPSHAYLAKGRFDVTLRLLAQGGVAQNGTTVDIASVPFQPHVVVGVPDSGFNVYHEVYRRPHMTAHPCTYIVGYPCGVPALELTFDAPSWEAAVEADRAKWASIAPGDRFWIPGTNIIGAVCDSPYQGSTVGSTDPTAPVDYCILGDSSDHGTGTSSSVLSENPDALLIVVEGNSGGAAYLTDGTFPVDVVNFSWGAAVPLFAPILQEDYTPMFVAASGNEGAFPVVLDSQKAHPSVITVGAADGATRTEPGYSGFKTMDFVSEYCRPAAHSQKFSGEDDYCGTSFSSPTFAGALSRIIYELRQESGYTGGVRGGLVDPVLGISKAAVREALNHTATYEPDSPFPAESEGVPLLTAAPYYQWGWGYVARNEVPEAIACLRLGQCPERPAATVAYMEALWTYRTTTSG